MTSSTNEQPPTVWGGAARREANKRDVVDALNDAELLLTAFDDPKVRGELTADFATSFWVQRYLPLVVSAGEEGRGIVVYIVQEQRTRWQTTLNEFS